MSANSNIISYLRALAETYPRYWQSRSSVTHSRHCDIARKVLMSHALETIPNSSEIWTALSKALDARYDQIVFNDAATALILRPECAQYLNWDADRLQCWAHLSEAPDAVLLVDARRAIDCSRVVAAERLTHSRHGLAQTA